MRVDKKPVFLDFDDLMRPTVKIKRKAENTVNFNNKVYSLKLNSSYLSSLIEQNARAVKRRKIEVDKLDHNVEGISASSIPENDISQERIAGEGIPTEPELIDISEDIAGEGIPTEPELLDISQEHISGEDIPTEPELLDISQEHGDDTQNPGLLKSNEEGNEEPMDELDGWTYWMDGPMDECTKAPDTIKPNQSDSVTIEENVKSFTFSSTWEPKANYNFTIEDNVNSFPFSSTLGSNAPMPSNKLNESSDLEMLPKRFGKTKVCFLTRHNLRLKDFICNEEEDDFSLVQPRLNNITSHLKKIRNKDNLSHWKQLQNYFCNLPSTEHSELYNPILYDDISSASETLSENLQVPPTNSGTSGEYQFPAEFCNNLVLTKCGYFKNYV